MTTQPPERSPKTASSSLWATWCQILENHRWLTFVLPFAVFLLSGTLESHFAAPAAEQGPAAVESRLPAEVSTAIKESPPAATGVISYPVAYSLRILATIAAIVCVLPGYRSIASFHFGGLAVCVGIVGGLLWIGICRLGLVQMVLTSLGLDSWLSLGARAAFNPFEALGDSMPIMVAFLAIRFLGLTLIVPLIEELFLRGFLMRFFVQAEWWKVPLGSVTWTSAAVATIYGVVAHPAEPLAAAIWFSLITALYARTRNLWDCVVAHAITNGILGVYVLTWKDWTLW